MILRRLEVNARESAATIANHVGVSERTVRNRISWLEAKGFILGYHAVLRGDLGNQTPSQLLELTLAAGSPEAIGRFVDGLCAMPFVLAVDQVDRLAFIIRAGNSDAGDAIAALALSAGVRVARLETRPILRSMPLGLALRKSSPHVAQERRTS